MSTAEEEETKTETAPAFGEEEAGDDVAVKEEESTATFAPLVSRFIRTAAASSVMI